MRKNEFESGWENLDHHPDITERPRPMFDAKGNAVETAPEPEPLTAAERAMFAAVEAGVDPAQQIPHSMDSFPHTILRGEHGPEIKDLATGGVIHEPLPYPIGEQGPERLPFISPVRHGRIRELATAALDSPSPAAWAVALAEILRELDA